MNLQAEVKSLLLITGKSKTQFAKEAGVSPTLFNLFCNKGYDLSDSDRVKVTETLGEIRRKLREYLDN